LHLDASVEEPLIADERERDASEFAEQIAGMLK
jgi:hypothetical protein